MFTRVGMASDTFTDGKPVTLTPENEKVGSVMTRPKK